MSFLLDFVMNYETVIGLEVHAQLLTKSKMYCSCSADYANTPPNTHVCPVCLGLPGVLPVINKQAVEFTMMTALALNCPIADFTRFDRKNYPYPDLMKGYQISQAYAPISKKGYIMIEVDGVTKKVGINHIHLEEDVAKLLHRNSGGEDYSLVDVNRSGLPLMEIVSEPDMRSAEEARQYLIKLHSILQYLGISTGNMEEGAFRCDANISIRPEGSQELGPKVEVKNLNSFKAVFMAMEYEAKRQRKAVGESKKLVQETRGWLDAEGKTVTQRTKEYAHDYRYFPEPDLPPITIGREWVEAVRKRLPELPEDRRDRFMKEYDLPVYDANLLTSSKAMADYFEEGVTVSKEVSPKEVGNWLLGEVTRILNTEKVDINNFKEKISPEELVELLKLVKGGHINVTTAKSLLEKAFQTQTVRKSVTLLWNVESNSQISDTGELEKIVAEVIKSNVQPVADYKAGKETALKFLVGQVMKASQGRANPQIVNEVLKRKLAEV
jgi:aspartyl-tRNA(Asn)/glutamyl-tRNA(Gln) amidotransferase subunit B